MRETRDRSRWCRRTPRQSHPAVAARLRRRPRTASCGIIDARRHRAVVAQPGFFGCVIRHSVPTLRPHYPTAFAGTNTTERVEGPESAVNNVGHPGPVDAPRRRSRPPTVDSEPRGRHIEIEPLRKSLRPVRTSTRTGCRCLAPERGRRGSPSASSTCRPRAPNPAATRSYRVGASTVPDVVVAATRLGRGRSATRRRRCPRPRPPAPRGGRTCRTR